MFTINQPMIENLNEFWQEFSNVPGFERYQSSDVLALKAPVKMPGVHFVWGKVTPSSIVEIKNFFNDTPIAWALEPNQIKEGRLLEDAGFEKTCVYPEMIFDLKKLDIKPISSEIEVKQVNTPELLTPWAEVAAKAFELPVEGLQNFVVHTLHSENEKIFIAFWNGTPVGTMITYLGSKTAGIYFVSVAAEMRKKGIAQALTQICLMAARERGLSEAALYSSDIGLSLYQKIGFRNIGEYHEYNFPKPTTS